MSRSSMEENGWPLSDSESALREVVQPFLVNSCTLLPPLAAIVVSYVEGVKYPHFPPLPANYESNGSDIFKASQADDINQLRFLVEVLHSDPDASDDTFLRERPIHYAASWGNLAAVQYLLSRGVRADSGSITLSTALHKAALMGHETLVDYFLRFHNSIAPLSPDAPPKRLCDITPASDVSLLHAACIGGLPRVVRRLVQEFGFDLPDLDRRAPNPALHLAIAAGHLNVVRTLVELGADIRGTDRQGDTALACAEEWEHFDIIEYLESLLT